MRIPKRVNTAWDWAEANQRVLAVVTTLLVAAIALRWAPALSTFVIGLTLGGLVVHRRMARRAARLRAEIDTLLRENGALQHQKTVLAGGVISSEALLTQRLPVIPDQEPEAEPEVPVLPEHDPKVLTTRRPPAVPAERESGAVVTQRLPALPDDGPDGP